jgi:tetratricopeptide (TPR) repeat protein
LEQAMAWASGAPTIDRVRVLTGASCFVRDQGDEPRATALGEEALRIVEALGAGRGIDAVHVLIGLALTAAIRADREQAVTVNEAILEILGDLREVEPSAAFLEGVVLVNLAEVVLKRGDEERATALVETALAHQQRFGFTWSAADSSLILARIAHRRGDLARATALYRQSLVQGWNSQDPQQIVGPLEDLMRLASATGHEEAVARLLGAGDRLSEQLGKPWARGASSGHGEVIAAVRGSLGEDRYEASWAIGRALSREQVIAEALALADAVAATARRPDRPRSGAP